MDGNYPICFWKGKVSDFTDPDPKYRWLILKNDKAVGKVSEDHEASMKPNEVLDQRYTPKRSRRVQEL